MSNWLSQSSKTSPNELPGTCALLVHEPLVLAKLTDGPASQANVFQLSD